MSARFVLVDHDTPLLLSADLRELVPARRAGDNPRGKESRPPQDKPGKKDQMNFTDPESRIMSRPKGDSLPLAARRVERSDSNTSSSFEQCDNAQAAVEVDSRLVVGQHVSNAPDDKEQLVPTVAVIELHPPGRYSLPMIPRSIYPADSRATVRKNPPKPFRSDFLSSPTGC